MNLKAFMMQLSCPGIESGVLGLTNVYTPEFNAKIDAAIKNFVTPYPENPWVIGYFTGKEPSWPGQEVGLRRLILERNDTPIKNELKKFLAGGDTWIISARTQAYQ